ncbi:MAG: SsrA-binding protein [Nitrospirae bacterium]|nr:MAG: SsrA-binding protein [Nitrospirota bacterium]
MSVVCKNSKAYHDYFIEDRIEAGMVLVGTEVKSLRAGRANLTDSYVLIKDNEVFLLNCHISPYSHGNIMNHEPTRTRKLLMNRKEVERTRGKLIQKGFTLIPLKIYFKGSYAKVEVGLCKGKAQYEKRESIKEREAKREIDKTLKERNR